MQGRISTSIYVVIVIALVNPVGSIAKASHNPEGASDPVLRASFDRCIESAQEATPALLKCTSDEFVFQDGRLNDVYRRLRSSMNAADKEALRKDELQWLAEKSDKCSQGDIEYQGDRVAAAGCEVNETAKRADELQRRLKK